MTPNTLSVLWTNIAPSLGDHLWQSTLFAAGAGLLTVTLRKNHARARYALWLTASIKFLIPFSWLVALGNRLSWLRTPVPSTFTLYTTVEQFSQPFTPNNAVFAAAPAVNLSFTHWIPTVLLAVWFSGFLAVILLWCLRWRQISRDLRAAIPVVEGREVDALRRAQQVTGLRKNVALLLSPARLEPGISACPGRCWSGPKAFRNIWRTRTWRPYSPTNSGMSAVVTISPPQFIWRSRRLSGSTRWSGGWVPASWTSVSEPAMNKWSNSAASVRCTPKAF